MEPRGSPRSPPRRGPGARRSSGRVWAADQEGARVGWGVTTFSGERTLDSRHRALFFGTSVTQVTQTATPVQSTGSKIPASLLEGKNRPVPSVQSYSAQIRSQTIFSPTRRSRSHSARKALASQRINENKSGLYLRESIHKI